MGPTIILEIWGTTSPTQPMTPLILTAAEVTRVAQIMIIKRILSTFTPRDLASSSPSERILMRHLRRNNTSIPMNMGFRMEDEPEDDDYFIPNGIEWQETMYKFNIEKESKIEKFKSDTTKSQFCS